MVNYLLILAQAISAGIIIKLVIDNEKCRRILSNHSEAMLNLAELCRRREQCADMLNDDIEENTNNIESIGYELNAIKTAIEMASDADTKQAEKIANLEKCINVLAENLDKLNQSAVSSPAPLEKELQKQFDFFNEWLNGPQDEE